MLKFFMALKTNLFNNIHAPPLEVKREMIFFEEKIFR